MTPEYSENFSDGPPPLPLEEESSLFKDKIPELGDFIQVELILEVGKIKSTTVNYPAKVNDW